MRQTVVPIHCRTGLKGGIARKAELLGSSPIGNTSILTPRKTVDREGHDTEILTKGRHDPCVGIRAVPVGEAMIACVLADHLLRHRGQVGG